MKMFKRILATVLAVLMLLSLAACGKKDADTDTTDNSGADKVVINADTKTKTLGEAGLSLNKILKANGVESLMKKHNTLTVKTQSSDGNERTVQIFRFGESLALASLKREANTAELVTGYINGFDFVVENDRVKAYRDVEELGEEAELDEDELITDFFEDKELAVLDVEEDSYILKSLSEDKKVAGERYFYIDKESLELQRVTYKNAMGNTESTEITFDGELEEFARKIADSFDGEMKTVTVVAKFSDGDEAEETKIKLSLPADWEYVPSGDGRIDYYMDKDMTEGYAYPGHGKDYTLYISNIFDEEDSGKK